MKHKKTLLFGAVAVGLVALFYHPRNGVVNTIDINKDGSDSLDKASQLMNSVNGVGTKAGSQAVFNNNFPVRTGDIKTEIYNPKTVVDLIAPKVFIIETEEDYLKQYTLANYVPNRLNAAPLAIVQAMPPEPMPPAYQPAFKAYGSFNTGVSSSGKTYGRVGRR